MDAKCKILILENFSLFSSGIKSILEKEDIEVIGEARDWEELFNLLKNIAPDIVLLDLIHNTEPGIIFLKKLRNEYPQIRVLLITNEGFSDYFMDFILIGVSGFVYSNATQSDLINAVLLVADGQECFPNGVIKIFKDTLQRIQWNTEILHHQLPLSTRETSVLKLFCKGLTYKEIGNTLNISSRTVETHKKHILSKINIKSTAEMVKYAVLHHLI